MPKGKNKVGVPHAGGMFGSSAMSAAFVTYFTLF